MGKASRVLRTIMAVVFGAFPIDPGGAMLESHQRGASLRDLVLPPLRSMIL